MPQILDIGAPSPTLADPRVEYVIGGPWGGITPSGGFLLAQVYDEIVRQQGPLVYSLMEMDPAVACSLSLLKAGVLSEGPKLIPPSEMTPAPGEIVSNRKRKQEVKLASDIIDYWTRGLDRLQMTDRPVTETLYEMLDALMQGCTLAEPVWSLSEEGPDRGKLVPTRFAKKPNWAWAFRTDRTLRVEAIRAWTTQGWVDVDRQHFAGLTWRPRDGDPRGSSLGKAIYQVWNLKVQTFNDIGEYLKKFASPSLVLEAGVDAVDRQVIDPVTGLSKTYSITQQLLDAGAAYRQHSVIALPNGARATVIQSQGNGEAFNLHHERFDRDIFRAMILSTRPVMEAKHGSKADSNSGMDLMGMAVQSVRDPLGLMFKKDVLFRGVELNWGPDIARRFTPDVVFGVPNHVAPELMAAFADAWSKGLFDVGQRPWLWEKIGAPQPPEQPEPVADPNAPADPQATGDGSKTDQQGNPPAKDQAKPTSKANQAARRMRHAVTA